MKKNSLLLIFFFFSLVSYSLDKITANHLVTLPLYQNETAFVVFVTGKGNSFSPDSIVLLAVNPIEASVDYNKNKNITLKDYVKSALLSINADEYSELTYNDKIEIAIDSVNTDSFFKYKNNYLLVSNSTSDKVGFHIKISKIYTSNDLILYNRKIYVKKSVRISNDLMN